MWWQRRAERQAIIEEFAALRVEIEVLKEQNALLETALHMIAHGVVSNLVQNSALTGEQAGKIFAAPAEAMRDQGLASPLAECAKRMGDKLAIRFDPEVRTDHGPRKH